MCVGAENRADGRTFDFWDDVIKFAWHDIIEYKFSDQLFKELCQEFDLSYVDALENGALKKEMHRLKSGDVPKDVDVPYVLCCMMHFHRSRQGIESFLAAFYEASRRNEGAWSIMNSIWKDHRKNQSSRCVSSKGENALKVVSFSLISVLSFREMKQWQRE